MPDCVNEKNLDSKSSQLESDGASVPAASQKSKSIDIPGSNKSVTNCSQDCVTPPNKSTSASSFTDKNEEAQGHTVCSDKTPQSPSSPPQSPGVHFEPLVHLELVDVKTMEENEVELFKMRGKLYRYDKSGDEAEWKERGTGDVKILQSKADKSRIRFIMRQEKTLKIRANHYIDPAMSLEHHGSSDRAFIWIVETDIAEGDTTTETFAVKFKNVEDAETFRETFQCAQETVNDCRDRMPAAVDPLESADDDDVQHLSNGESEVRDGPGQDEDGDAGGCEEAAAAEKADATDEMSRQMKELAVGEGEAGGGDE